MVSTKTKIQYSTAKLGRAGKSILPILSRENPSELVNEILREDEEIRNIVTTNPAYREFLYKKVLENFQKYKGVIYGSKVVDSWDRVTSAIGLAADAVGPFSGGIGTAISGAEEIVEGVPKGIYAVYYLAKTGDWKSIPIWGAAELASMIPYLGDAIDMTNLYVQRARKFVKKSVKKDFREITKKSLEQRVAA